MSTRKRRPRGELRRFRKQFVAMTRDAFTRTAEAAAAATATASEPSKHKPTTTGAK